MSAANIAGWFPIHGLRQDLLNEMKLTRGSFGQGYKDPTFSPEAYIHRMFEKRPMLTRLHQLLSENIPGTIRVRFTKNGALHIHVMPFAGFSPYDFIIDNMYDFIVPPIAEYETFMNRRDLGGYLPIRASVYRIVKMVAQEIQAAALGEMYEAAADRTGHPESGNVRHGPVGIIMRFGGYKRSKKSRKIRKAGSSKARK